MAAQASEQSGLAKRYAAALFGLADEKQALDSMAADLAALDAMIAESGDLRRVIHSPLYDRGEQGKAMAALIKARGLSDLTGNFVGLLAKNRRLSALPGVIKVFHTLLAEKRGEQAATVITAQPLTPAQESALAEALRTMAGGKVSVSVKTDPDLLGGLVVKIGSRMIDHSLRTKLQKMRLAMKGVA